MATTRYQATTLRRFYHYLLEQGLVDQNPLVGIQFDEVGGARGNLPNYQLLMDWHANGRANRPMLGAGGRNHENGPD